MNCNIYNELYKLFPREIGVDFEFFGFKRIFVNDRGKFCDLINSCSYDFNTYTTIYGGFREEKDYKSGIIDKIVLDIDNINDWENVKELHYYLLKKDVKHTIIFSGSKGFHVYIFTDKSYTSEYRKGVRNVGIKFMEAFNLDVDIKILGDMARLIRIPNSINKKSKLFAIPLTDKHFNMNIEEIKKEARKPNLEYSIWGNIGIKLKQKVENNFEENDNFDVVNINNIVLPPFLTTIIRKKKQKWERKTGHYERILIILYLFEAGNWNIEMVKRFMRSILTNEEYNHMEQEKQVEYLYRRFYILKDYNFPSIQTIESWLGIKLNEVDIKILKEQIYDLRKEALEVIKDD